MNNITRIILAVLLGAFLLLSVSSMQLKSPTWDETNYLGLGYYLVNYRQWDVPAATLHPPFLIILTVCLIFFWE